MPAEDAACTTGVAGVHRDPDTSSEQVTQALAGEPLRVLERRDGWARILTAYDYPGWINQRALGPPTAAPWPGAPTFSDPIEAARSYLGSPYLWGGMSTAGIDCSGLVHMAHRHCGRIVPRDADQQEAAGLPIADEEGRRGDLLTYGEPEEARPDHIAFWLGDGWILHATAREDLGVVEEREPDEVHARRRRFVRLREATGRLPPNSD